MRPDPCQAEEFSKTFLRQFNRRMVGQLAHIRSAGTGQNHRIAAR
jgi:hypothetical protein